MCKDNITIEGTTADKELFSLPVDHNANLNQSHAVLIFSYKKKLFFHVFRFVHIFSQFDITMCGGLTLQ
jgi:hypothetical protein